MRDVSSLLSGAMPCRPIVLSGPSGGGKSTILARAMKEYPNSFAFSVSREFSSLQQLFVFRSVCNGVRHRRVLMIDKGNAAICQGFSSAFLFPLSLVCL